MSINPKALIMLSSIAVLAIAGAAIAAKARNTQTIWVRSNPFNPVCDYLQNSRTLIGSPGQPPVLTTYATTVIGACPLRVPIYTGL